MKKAKKLLKRISAVFVAFALTAAISVNSFAYISSAYQGSYYCTDLETGFFLLFMSSSTSVFKGSLSGNPSVTDGIYSASNMNGANSTIDQTISTDNMIVRYDTIAKLSGDQFYAQAGSLILIGTAINTSKIRIRGIGGYYYYER